MLPRPNAQITVMRAINDNGARAKSPQPRARSRSARGWSGSTAITCIGEYGDLDSDYVFVNLWGGPFGRPLTYAAVYDLVGRLRRAPASTSIRTGAGTPTPPGCCATGTPVEVVSRLLGHAR